ncbi:hypothetical protein ONZ45_g4392 [Pleurotus djamor]|nr:hypothetical protein ONZ45_g4392 [Pleurotus djamor]
MDFEDNSNEPFPGTGLHAPKRSTSPEEIRVQNRVNSTGNSQRSRVRKASAYVDKDPESNLLGVWDTYIDVSMKSDAALLEGWNRSMDVLLVFTGLFSAVLTTFLIESYEQLNPDPSDATNLLLTEIVALLRNDSSFQSVTQPPPHLKQTGLSTALISMLAKQWLQHYQLHDSGSSHQRARSRQMKFMQLQAWKVPVIINCLPLLLHVALLLFFAGLGILLWTADLSVAISTSAICIVAYGFYLSSIALPFIFPNCPYYHPISRYLLTLNRPPRTQHPLLRWTVTKNCYSDDELDALALAWLLTCSNDVHVRNEALRGIASLPLGFSALHILLDAGAEEMALIAFEDCFQKDDTADIQWNLVDSSSAEVFCRTWLNLTWTFDTQWPLHLLDPLWVLQDLMEYPDARAIATCAVAKSSPDSMQAQWEVISLLGQSVYGRIRLSNTTCLWLLETISDTLCRWEMPQAVVEETAVKSISILLQLFCDHQDSPGNSKLRCAAAHCLHLMTVPLSKRELFHSAERRSHVYTKLMVQALSCIAEAPQRFRITNKQLDMIARLLARFATAILDPSNDTPNSLQYVARSSISKLMAEGRISLSTVSENVLTDSLQLIYPPAGLHPSYHADFATHLVENIELSINPDIVSWSIRCLEYILRRPSPPLISEFVGRNGIDIVLRAARMSTDSDRLHVDGLRAICTFVRSSAHLVGKQDPDFYAKIFGSDFFNALLLVLNARSDSVYPQLRPAWWLSEVHHHWIPALTVLCRVRPHLEIWRPIISSIIEFADTHDTTFLKDVVASLTVMVNLIGLENLGDVSIYRLADIGGSHDHRGIGVHVKFV